MTTPQEDALVDLLHRVKKILDAQNIEFWLDCGTLLGAVRDGKFISWEHDIDFGAWQDRVSESVKISISRELCKYGLDTGIYENHINIRKKEVEEMWLDINFYYLNKDKVTIPRLSPINLAGKFLRYFLHVLFAPYHCKIERTKSIMKRLTMKALINISCAMPFILRKWLIQIGTLVYKKMGSKDVSWIIPSKYFMSLSTMKFYGMEFKVPAKTEEYLIYRYGENWRIPRKDWITNRDDGTIGNFSF